jgi:hypothetical protein
LVESVSAARMDVVCTRCMRAILSCLRRVLLVVVVVVVVV